MGLPAVAWQAETASYASQTCQERRVSSSGVHSVLTQNRGVWGQEWATAGRAGALVSLRRDLMGDSGAHQRPSTCRVEHTPRGCGVRTQTRLVTGAEQPPHPAPPGVHPPFYRVGDIAVFDRWAPPLGQLLVGRRSEERFERIRPARSCGVACSGWFAPLEK